MLLIRAVSVMETSTSSLLLLLLLCLPCLALSSYLDNSTLQELINNRLTESGNHQYSL